jgi:cytochrome c oxidase assembly protein subunit 15
VLGAVIFQGVLGGLRVVWVELWLAVVHACFAQAFFCLAALTAVVTSRWWVEAPDRSTSPVPRGLVRWSWVVVACLYVQLIAGALMRHYDAGLAIPDLPLAYGKLLPPTDAHGLDQANELRRWSAGLYPVTFGQVWLHFAHRIGAVVVTAAASVLIVKVLRGPRLPGLTMPTFALAGLLLTQLGLGVFTVLYRKPADVASAHVAAGALVLLSAFVIAVRATRLYSPRLRASECKPETMEPEGAPSGAELLPA